MMKIRMLFLLMVVLALVVSGAVCESPPPETRSETTLYEGIKTYVLTSAGWWYRQDGVVDTNVSSYFPDINLRNTDTAQLLSDLGLPTDRTSNATEVWQRTCAVWNWLRSNLLTPGTTDYNNAKSYYDSLDSWPSFADISYVYTHFGGIYVGTCMSRAQNFATLLWVVGVHPDLFAIAESKWKPEYSQHMFVILYINPHWYYVDPTCLEQKSLSSGKVESVGCIGADYKHPNTIKIVPESSLNKVPLVE